MRAILRVLVVAAALSSGAALGAPVHLVLSDDAAAYRQVARAVGAAFGPGEHTVGLVDDPIPDGASLLVAVGTAATQRVVVDERPVVATLLPEAAWSALVAGGNGAPRTAVFLDQPIARQVAFVRVLLPGARELGVVFGPTSAATQDAVLRAADRHNFHVHHVHARDPDDANDAAAIVLRRAEALLALPDAAVYNRFTVQSVLLTSFRARRPVIGFSEAWVRAGALGALHTTPAQLGVETGELVARWLAVGGALPAPRHPSNYDIAVNRQVAVSLGVHLPSDATLRDRLRALEEAP